MLGKRQALLGYVVWHGGKWYLRRRSRLSTRALAVLAVAGGAGLAGAAAALARRATR